MLLLFPSSITGIPKDQRWVTHCSCCEIPANASHRMTQSLDPNKSWQTSTSRAANFSRDGLVMVHPVREGHCETSTLKRTHQQLQWSIPVLADHTTGIRISLIQFQPFYDSFSTPSYFYDSVIFQDQKSKHATILPLKWKFCFSLSCIKTEFFKKWNKK